MTHKITSWSLAHRMRNTPYSVAHNGMPFTKICPHLQGRSRRQILTKHWYVSIILYYVTLQMTIILSVYAFIYLLQTSYNKTTVHRMMVPKYYDLLLKWILSLTLNNDNVLNVARHRRHWKRVQNLAWKTEVKRTVGNPTSYFLW